MIGWGEGVLAGYPDVLEALSGLEDLGLPEGVGMPGVPAVEVYDDVVLYTFLGDEDVYEGGIVRQAWRRAVRADFAGTVTAEWEAHVERVRACLPAVERVLRVAELSGLMPPGGSRPAQRVTLWPVEGVCVLEGLAGWGGWNGGVRVSASMADELVEVTLHGINHGYPWRAAVEPAARVLEAGLDWLADQVDVDDVEEPAYDGREDADGAGELPVDAWQGPVTELEQRLLDEAAACGWVFSLEQLRESRYRGPDGLLIAQRLLEAGADDSLSGAEELALVDECWRGGGVWLLEELKKDRLSASRVLVDLWEDANEPAGAGFTRAVDDVLCPESLRGGALS